METVRPAPAPEGTSPGKALSPSKTMWPAPWTLPLMVGTLPLSRHHHPGLRESACWLLLVSFSSKQSLASSLNPFPDFRSESSERTIAWDSGPPHKEPCRMAEPSLAGTKQGRGPGPHHLVPASGNCCWGASQGVALTLPPVLLAGTGLLNSRVSRCLPPAFGLILHLTPDPAASSHGLQSLCGE